MEELKIGMREFRENLANQMDSGAPLAITRNRKAPGFYFPAHKRGRKAELEAVRAAAQELEEMIVAWGVSEGELMTEYKEIRQSGRGKRPDGKNEAILG